MAKRAGKPSAAARSRRKTPVKRKANPLANEVKLLCLAALGILLLLSVYVEGAVGFVGQFLSRLFMGMLGFGAYILPFVVLGVSVYALFSKTHRFPSAVIAKAAVFFWCFIAFMHVVTVKELAQYPHVGAYFVAMYKEGSLTNGGLMGALLGNFLRGMLGPAGAYIALVVGALITLVLLTGHSFVSVVQGAAGGISNYLSGLRERWVPEPVDDPGEPEEAQTLSMPPRVKPAKAPRPPRPAKAKPPKKTERTRPELPVIADRGERVSNRVMLVNEEIKKNEPVHPIFAPRKPAGTSAPASAAPKASATPSASKTSTAPSPSATSPDPAPPAASAPPETPAFDANEPSEITVKGLVDMPTPHPAAHPKAYEGTKAYDDTFPPDFFDDDDDEPFDIDSADDMTMPDDDPDILPLHPPRKDRPSPPKPEARPAPRPAPKPEPKAAGGMPPVSMPAYEEYQSPPITLLTKNQQTNTTGSRTQILENSRILEETLKNFRVEAKVVEVSVGPTVTRYDLAPGPGVKVATIANLSNDLALSLAAQGIRIEAPIPGKAAVGIEIPNKDPQPVLLREIIEDDAFQKFPSRLAFAVGKDIAGNPIVTDVGRMPHLLIAGATGSGKSVCINTLVASLLYKSRPDEVKLLMVDPKVVELSVYNGIPHLLIPVVTDPKKASGALQWAVNEMESRYGLFAEAGVRDLKGYNEYLDHLDADSPPLPQIVIIIDELADLMMVCKGEVEESICRLAQKARAAGIHLIVATQRPSVDVITGLIKANIPSRLAFAVSSGIDSRTVLDMYGAEKLLGKGDMLFLPMGRNKPIRLQGGFISDKEVETLVDFLKKQTVTEYPPDMIEKVTTAGRAAEGDEDLDEFFQEAVAFLLEKGKASTSMLQRQFRIGYNRASRLMEDLEDRGIVGPEDGVKPRKILITREEFYNDYE